MNGRIVRTCVVWAGIAGCLFFFYGALAAKRGDPAQSAASVNEMREVLQKARARQRLAYPGKYTSIDWMLRTGLPGSHIVGADDELLFLASANGVVWLDTANGTADIVRAERCQYIAMDRDGSVFEYEGTRYTVSRRGGILSVSPPYRGNKTSQSEFSATRANAVLRAADRNASPIPVNHYVDTALTGDFREAAVHSTGQAFVIVRSDGWIEYYATGEARSESENPPLNAEEISVGFTPVIVPLWSIELGGLQITGLRVEDKTIIVSDSTGFRFYDINSGVLIGAYRTIAAGEYVAFDRRVLAVDGETVHCVDVESGASLWTRRFKKDNARVLCAKDDFVVIGIDDALVGLCGDTGNQIWENTTFPHEAYTFVSMSVDGVYLFSRADRCVAFCRFRDGTVVSLARDIDSPISAYRGGVLYARLWRLNEESSLRYLVRCEADGSGTRNRMIELPDTPTRIVSSRWTGDRAYIISDDAWRLDLRTGRIVWRHPLSRMNVDLAAATNEFLFIAEGNTLTIFDGASGKQAIQPALSDAVTAITSDATHAYVVAGEVLRKYGVIGRNGGSI